MTSLKLIPIFLILALLNQTCIGPINLLTKNWRKEIINKKCDYYDIVVDVNLSTGCPKSITMLGKDSIKFNNSYLPGIIKHLIDKNESRIEFVNMKVQKDMRFDIYFYAKKNHELHTNKDTILNILAKNIKFSIGYDSVISKVHDVKIIDWDKLKKHSDTRMHSLMRKQKNEIEFYGSSLVTIFGALENNVKIIIDYNFEETSKYQMIIPYDNINNLITYLKNECGIELIEKEKKVEIAKVTFNDLK